MRLGLLVVSGRNIRSLPSCISASFHLSSLQNAGKKEVSIPDPVQSGAQSFMPKGTGGRNSFSGMVCTIFGATGWAGRFVAQRFAKNGAQLILPYRCDPYFIRQLKLCGDLGQVLFMPFHLLDEEAIRKCVKYSNIVINMIGRDYDTWNFSMWDVHRDGARRIARICKEMGVERHVFVSALNASSDPGEFIIPGGSEFLRSKAGGEEAVREEFPGAVVVRPALMYGHFDKFLRHYAFYLRKSFLNAMDLWMGGEDTYKMPLFGADLAPGVYKAAVDPTLVGQTIEAVGPHCYKMSELVKWLSGRIGRGVDAKYPLKIRNNYGPALQWRANFMEWKLMLLKRQPRFNWELIERNECHSDVLTGCPTLSDIGVRNLTVFEHAARAPLDFELSKIAHLELPYKDAFVNWLPPPQRSPPIIQPKKKKRPVVSTQTFGHRAFDLQVL